MHSHAVYEREAINVAGEYPARLILRPRYRQAIAGLGYSVFEWQWIGGYAASSQDAFTEAFATR